MEYITFSFPPFPIFIKGAESVFPKGQKHFRRTFSVFDLLYVKKGCLYMTEENKEFAVKEGEYLILIPGREHYGHYPCTEETQLVWLHFTIEGGYDVVPKQSLSWQNVIEREATYVESVQYRFWIRQYAKVKQRERIEQLLQQLVELNEERDPDRSLKQLLYFVEFLWQLQKQELHIPSASEKVCAEAVACIERHYAEPITIQQLAQSLRFHPDYITRCMQKTIGMSFVQYLNYYRLSKAKKWLAETNETIEAIAKRAGIEDGAYFSRLFKKIEGVTPTEYRRTVHRM